MLGNIEFILLGGEFVVRVIEVLVRAKFLLHIDEAHIESGICGAVVLCEADLLQPTHHRRVNCFFEVGFVVFSHVNGHFLQWVHGQGEEPTC